MKSPRAETRSLFRRAGRRRACGAGRRFGKGQNNGRGRGGMGKRQNSDRDDRKRHLLKNNFVPSQPVLKTTFPGLRRQFDNDNPEEYNNKKRKISMANSTKIVAKIDKDACIGCGACEDICASTAIHIENGIAQVTEEDCIGCGACVDACPLEAIQLA